MIKNLKYLDKKEWFMLIFSVFFILLQVKLDLAVPEYMTKITELVQTDGNQMSEIIQTGSYMLFASLGSVVASIFTGFLAAQIGAGLGMNLRKSLFGKVQAFSLEEVNRFSTESLITRTTNDVNQIQIFITASLQVLIKVPILSISVIRKIIGKSWQWTALVGGTILFLLIIIVVIVFVAVPKFKKVQELTDHINLVTRENLTGLEVVRAYNAEDYQEAKFQNSSQNLSKNNLFASRVMALLPPSLQVSLSAISLGVFWLGAYIIQAASMGDKLNLFSDMVVFSSYALQIIGAFMLLSVIFILFPKASVSAKRVNEVLDTDPKIVDGKGVGKTKIKGTIEFKDVSFSYPKAEENVLTNISFSVSQGETIAFIGATGSGKSSLVNLIPRLYDVSEGKIFIDGAEIKDYTLEELYNKIGYVSQKSVLFSGTVASNIDFGKGNLNEITDTNIENALDIAQGMDFVGNLPKGIYGNVAQEGANFSGGQKQRVSIARAIAREPEIFIFDDSFSALDYKTDQMVRQALDEKTGNSTKFIVAQRIGTIIDADKIIVLDKGKIVGRGKHDELLKTCQVYREIAESQLPKEELYND